MIKSFTGRFIPSLSIIKPSKLEKIKKLAVKILIMVVKTRFSIFVENTLTVEPLILHPFFLFSVCSSNLNIRHFI